MIPFNKVSITKVESDYVNECLESRRICGDCKYTKLVSDWFEVNLKTKVLLTTSCTHALEMAAQLAGIQPGDEIIVPSYTFVSTVNAFALRGGIPVFIDIDPKTMNLDVNLIEEKITSKTKAIFPVHYAGIACDMDKIMELAKKYNLIVIEDAAQAVGSYYKGKLLGTIGDYGCYSFHETKNYSMGEGGALITREETKYLEAEIIREKGTNRSQFIKGMVDKYTWHAIGSSYLPSDILAAVLYGQLQRYQEIMEKRLKIWNAYHKLLEKYEALGKLNRPYVPEYSTNNAHMYYVILPSMKERDELISLFKNSSITAPFHYIPLHTSPMGSKYGYKKGDLPLTEEYSERLIRLPLFVDMNDDEMNEICKVLTRKFEGDIL